MFDAIAFLIIKIKFHILERMKKMGKQVGGVEVSYLAENRAVLIQNDLASFELTKTRFKLDVAICLVVWGYEDKVTDPDYLEQAKKKIEEASEQ